MKEHYVSYEQSVKLKELGFEGNGLKNYIRQGYYKFPNGNISPIKHDGDGILVQFRKENAERIPAPRLDQAQAWLREVKKWHIIVEPRIWEQQVYDFKLWHFHRGYENANRGLDYLSYDLALSAGIDKALKLLGDNTQISKQYE